MTVVPARRVPGVAALLLLVAIGTGFRAAGAALPPDREPEAASLAGQLLVASRSLEDPNFRRTVVYMVEHDAGGAMGLVVNRVVASGPLGTLLEGFGIEVEADPAIEIDVHYGGPVAPSSVFVLHSPDYESDHTVRLSDTVALTSSPDILRAMAAGRGPRESLLAVGYAGWAPGQLEDEIAAGAWEVVPADPSLIFELPAGSRWRRALERRGIDL